MKSDAQIQLWLRLARFFAAAIPVMGVALLCVWLVYGSLDWDGFIASLLSSFVSLGIGTLAAYLLLYRPLSRSLSWDLDPLATQRAAPAYPQWGFSIVKQFLSSAHDSRLQREAFGRLTEAYRSLSQLDQADLTVKKAVAVAVHSGLAKSVTPYALDIDEGALAPMVSNRDLPSRTSEAVIRSVASEQLEFQHEGEYWLAIPLPHREARFFVLRVEPRQLWSRLPKVYRRYFSTLGSSIITYALSRSQDATTADGASSPLQSATEAGIQNPSLNQSQTLIAPIGNLTELPENFFETQPEQQAIVSPGPKKALALVNGEFRSDLHQLTHAIGYTQRVGLRFSGDFIALTLNLQQETSITFLGHIPGGRADNSLAASGALAILAEHLGSATFETEELAEKLLKNMIELLHRFSFRVFGGQLGVCLTAIEYSHQTGKGRFASFGLPLPFLVSPGERKPLILSPNGTGHGMLGIAESLPRITFTPFSLLPGQLIFACTAALLDLRNAARRSFEKELVRGRLAAINETQFKSSARNFADQLIWLAESHSNNSFLNEDISLVVMGPKETFKK